MQALAARQAWRAAAEDVEGTGRQQDLEAAACSGKPPRRMARGPSSWHNYIRRVPFTAILILCCIIFLVFTPLLLLSSLWDESTDATNL